MSTAASGQGSAARKIKVVYKDGELRLSVDGAPEEFAIFFEALPLCLCQPDKGEVFSSERCPCYDATDFLVRHGGKDGATLAELENAIGYQPVDADHRFSPAKLAMEKLIERGLVRLVNGGTFLRYSWTGELVLV